MGDLGNTHYLSLLLKWGQAESRSRNLIQFQPHKGPGVVETDEEQKQLILLLEKQTTQTAEESHR